MSDVDFGFELKDLLHDKNPFEPDTPKAIPEIKMNEDQENAAKGLYDFLHSDGYALKLTGSAGTGKTFVIQHLLNQILPNYVKQCEEKNEKPKYQRTLVCATTNKAAAVLSSSLGMGVPTVHSLLNLVLKSNFKTGELDVIKNNRTWQKFYNAIIIIDEYTYINKELLAFIYETVDSDTCKIIFVGDKNQLTPVKENSCKIDDLSMPVLTLNKPVRNSEYPALMKLCEVFKQGVINDSLEGAKIELEDGVVEFYPRLEDIAANIFDTFDKPDYSAKILAFSNKTVINYNEQLRMAKGIEGIYTEGERLIFNEATLGYSDYDLSVVMAPNETEVEVISVNTDDTLMFPVVDPNTEEILTDIPYYEISVDIPGKGLSTFRVAYDADYLQACIKELAAMKLWIPYFKLKENFADIRPDFASTIHKSQGSTYDTVFIDMGDVTKCNISPLVRRLLYVAVSRAKKRVVFFNTFLREYGKLLN